MKRSERLAIGQRIRKIRGKMTQADFAKVLGVYKQNYISRYERGRIPLPDLLYKIAEHGNVTMHWLYTGKEGKTYRKRTASYAKRARGGWIGRQAGPKPKKTKPV